MTSTRSKIGALLVKPALKETLKSFDATEYGGAPLLGLKGLVVKTHGSAKAIEIKHGIFQCVQFKQEKINEKIAERILEDQEVLKSGAEQSRTGTGRRVEDGTGENKRLIIAEVLNIDADSITEDTTFVDDLGADSLDIFQIIMGIEEEYDIELDNESVEQIQTVGDAVEAIRTIK